MRFYVYSLKIFLIYTFLYPFFLVATILFITHKAFEIYQEGVFHYILYFVSILFVLSLFVIYHFISFPWMLLQFSIFRSYYSMSFSKVEISVIEYVIYYSLYDVLVVVDAPNILCLFLPSSPSSFFLSRLDVSNLRKIVSICLTPFPIYV